MATEKQIAANRANAQKCTGPRTEEGKATSSMNALKTGLDAKSEIIERCENRAERDELTAAYYARYAPVTEEERYLVDTAIAHEWLQRRYLSVEASLWKGQFDFAKSLGGAFNRESETFARIDRRLNSALRNHGNAMKRLHALRALRGAGTQGDIPLAKTCLPAEPEISECNPQADQPIAPPLPDETASVPAPEPEPVAAQDAPGLPSIDVAPEELDPELVSFRTFAEPVSPHAQPGPSTFIPPTGPNHVAPTPAQSDII